MFQFSPSKRKDYHLAALPELLPQVGSFNLVPPKGRIITMDFAVWNVVQFGFNLVPPKGRIITETRLFIFQNYYCFNLVPPKGRIITY